MSYPTGLVTVDGTDLGTLGFVVEGWTGDLAPALDAPPTRPAGDGWGERVSGAPAALPARTLTVTGTLLATAATLRSARDTLIAACAGGASGPASAAVTLVVTPSGDTLGRQYTAYLTRAVDLTRVGPTAITDGARVALTFTCPDPTAATSTATVVALSTTIARTALGDLQVRPVITIDGGAWTTTTVTYKDGADVTVSSFTLTKPTGDAGVGHTVEVDCAAESVVWVNGSTRTPKNTWLTAGDFVTLDPADAVSATNPGLVLSAGTGSVTYRKRWR